MENDASLDAFFLCFVSYLDKIIVMSKISIRMLSSATSVPGQGVGSAYMEQVSLIKEQKDLFEVYEGKDKGKALIHHVHTVDPKYRLRMTKNHVNVIYVHFLPTTLDGSISMPKFAFNVFKRYVRSTYKKADEIVVVNPIFIKPLVELGAKEENITFIPNYVSKEEFFPLPKEDSLKAREKYGIKKEAFLVLGCGQVQNRKGVKDFLACALANPDKEFAWAGGFSFGKMSDGYKELKGIMDNPPPNLHFLGLLERKEMNAVFNMADLFFMPSYDELMPMAILEAVNCDKPVLLRDLDLYPGIFFDYYEAAHDVTGFDKQIKRLAEDGKAYEEAKEKARKIGQFYSKEHVASLWREYYPRIAKKWVKKKKIKFEFDE